MIKITDLTDDQSKALRGLLSFMQDDRKSFHLSGYAGTGKSVLMGIFIQEYYKILNLDKSQIASFPITVCAPTHKAKHVIEKTTGIMGQTIHSMLGLRPDIDTNSMNPNSSLIFKTGETVQGISGKMPYYKLIIIDEGSMINKAIYTIIIDVLNKTWKLVDDEPKKTAKIGMYKTKVIYVSDPAQLPPVNELKSLIYTHVDYTLTHVVRQALDNPIISLATKLRSNYVINKSDQNLIESKGEYTGVIIYDDEKAFKDRVLLSLISNPNGLDKIKVLSWKNDSIIKWNKFIRNKLLDIWLRNDSYLVKGEHLMSYINILKVSNSEEITVGEIRKEETVFGIRSTIVGLKKTGINNICYVRILVPEITNYQAYLDKLLPLYKQAIDTKEKSAWRAYYAFKGQYMIMHDIKNKEGQVLAKRDIDYAYALSVHKSQGSTFDEVYIDYRDISKSPEVQQLSYVGVTRASKLVHILINP